MVRFEGDREFAMSPEQTNAHLTDVAFLVGCIPDVESVQGTSADEAQLVLRPGFAFVRGTLDVVMRVVERTSLGAQFALTSRGIGSSSEVLATLLVAERPGGSRVHWTAEVKSLGGLLKLVPAGLIRGAAEKVINDAWDRIEKKLAAE